MTARGRSAASAGSSPPREVGQRDRPRFVEHRARAAPAAARRRRPRATSKPLAAPTKQPGPVLLVAQQDAREVGAEGVADPLRQRRQQLAQRRGARAPPRSPAGASRARRPPSRPRRAPPLSIARAAPLGHVEHLPDQVERAVVGVDGERHAHERVRQLAVAAREAQLGAGASAGALDEPRHSCCSRSAAVVGMGELPERARERAARATGRACRRAPRSPRSSRRPPSLNPMPIGAPSKAVRKRSSDSRSAAFFSASSSSIATFERSTSGSTGLTM